MPLLPPKQTKIVTDLGLDVIKRGWADDGEADEKNVGLRVRERSETIVIFLSGSIPKSKADGLAIDHYTRRVVVETVRFRAISDSFSLFYTWDQGTRREIKGSGGEERPRGYRRSRSACCDIHCRDVLAGEGVCRV